MERFWNKVQFGDWLDCWPWTGYCQPKGYGRFGDQLAHRVAYALLVGPIPDGLQLDHLCRSRGCVNPLHLEPVTNLENSRRGLKGVLRTHCPHGHRLTPDNIYGPYANGRRRCRTCALT